MSVEGIKLQILERRDEPEIGGVDAVIERAALSANRTVTDAHVVKVGVDFEPDAPAMA